jgi:hypothetical protein
MSTLMEEFARIVTDAGRMEWDNSDPARYSKRVAKDLAMGILSDAVVRAARALELPKLIDDDCASCAAAAMHTEEAP